MQTNPNLAIECSQLTKTYANGATALHELNLKVERATSWGLMGENGAGKSTLVRLLLGFIFPTTGKLHVLGHSQVQHAHPQLGYLHERPFVELRFVGRRYLNYMAALSGLKGTARNKRVEAVLEEVDLTAAANERLATYSKGMLQRINIAQALLADPELLILDEPTSGLDPYSQWKVRQIIAELRERGKTILLCSHHVGEVEMLCHNIGILHRGKLVQYGAVKTLLNSPDKIEIVLAANLAATEICRNLGLTKQILQSEGNRFQILASSQATILAKLVAANIPLHSLNPVSRSLEELYIHSVQPENQLANSKTK